MSGVVINGRFLTRPVTGVERYAGEITRQLVSMRDDLTVLHPNRPLHEFNSCRVPMRRVGGGSGHSWEQIALPLHLRRSQRPTLLSLANVGPMRYRRQLVVIHDCSPLRHPHWFTRQFVTAYRAIWPQLTKHAAQIVTVSEFSRQEIVELLGVPADRIAVAGGAVAPDLLDSTDADIPRQDFVLAVSSRQTGKNFERLLVALTRPELENIPLVIVGKKPGQFADPRLEERIARRRHTRLAGYVSDEELRQLYRTARLFVFPSLYEGFGLPPLEAMACGCPVVAARAASIPEVCGAAAEYVDPTDIDSIADGVSRVYSDSARREALIRTGYEVARRHSWSRSASVISACCDAIHEGRELLFRESGNNILSRDGLAQNSEVRGVSDHIARY